MGIALVVEAGDGEIDVMPETDVTAKTVLGEPAKGSADQSDLQDIGGLLGAENGCCSGSEESWSILVDIAKSSFRMDYEDLF